MYYIHSVLVIILSLCTAILTIDVSPTYDYIVVGSGPGGGPLAANLAKSGASVLLLEAGSDEGNNPAEYVAGLFFLADADPAMRWDFFVKYHSDEKINRQYEHLTWRTTNGQFYVGTNPPVGAVELGVYYPRAGTLGGCTTHNAMCAVLPSESDWQNVVDITGDASWSPENMRRHFEAIENNHYVASGTPGHGFNGYLDTTLNNDEVLKNQSNAQIVLRAVAEHFDQDPDDIFQLVQRDANNADPDRDNQTGIFGFPTHRDGGYRVSSRNPIVDVLNGTNSNGEKYNLTLRTESLVTKVLFDTSGTNETTPRAIGVEFLAGKSMYSADPRYIASNTAPTLQAFARKEVILSGGVFNSPQLLKLSGVGPKEELAAFDIPVLVDLPGVGSNLQDNNEASAAATFQVNFASLLANCRFGAPGDPCLAAWSQGKGPYVTGPLDLIMFKSSEAAYDEDDILLWASPGAFRGFWPAVTVNPVPGDTPNTFSFSIVKIHSRSHLGTVKLKSANPRDTPDINFRFFEGDEGNADLKAMAEAVEMARTIWASLEDTPLGQFNEVLPCVNTTSCDVEDWIRKQSWSHHATGTCSIGADDDELAVLDSQFRVRGTEGLRVVDASVFPRNPGSFPAVPTFMLSQKATEVILGNITLG